MATYVVGDIQGCFETLQRLLRRLEFSADRDRLWLTGDLVNRGPSSLAVLRWASAHDHCVTSVMGNHDLHLVAIFDGIRRHKTRDTLNAVLTAPDAGALVGWLAARPFLHREGKNVLVHAAILPSWSMERAEHWARAVEAEMVRDRKGLLDRYFAAKDTTGWPATGSIAEKTVVAPHVLTRLRICTADGKFALDFGRGRDSVPPGFRPWFDWPLTWAQPAAAAPSWRVFAGHWAALGLHQSAHVVTLDTGCVYGGALTAFRLEDGALFQEPRVDEVG